MAGSHRSLCLILGGLKQLTYLQLHILQFNCIDIGNRMGYDRLRGVFSVGFLIIEELTELCVI